MGMFSWLTSDTGESIRVEEVRNVYLLQPGGEAPIKEECYNGYGDFGEIDAYVWLAIHNLPQDEVDAVLKYEPGTPEYAQGLDRMRAAGIELDFDERDEPLRFPLKFSFNPDAVYEDLPASEPCPNQGFM